MTGVRLGRGDLPRGWTFDLGIPEIVAGYSNPSDLEQYRQLRFGGQAAADAWRRELSHGGLLYYRGLTGEAAQRLLDVLPPSALAERQNDAPTVGTFLRAATAHPDEIELTGYCVGPDRADERFSVEGLRLFPSSEAGIDLYVQTFDEWAAEVPDHEDRCQCEELWEIVQSRYGVDDAITFPTRMAAVEDFGVRSPRRGWLLWWT